MGCAGGGVVRVDGRPPRLLPRPPRLPHQGDQEVQQAAHQSQQKGVVSHERTYILDNSYCFQNKAVNIFIFISGWGRGGIELY